MQHRMALLGGGSRTNQEVDLTGPPATAAKHRDSRAPPVERCKVLAVLRAERGSPGKEKGEWISTDPAPSQASLC